MLKYGWLGASALALAGAWATVGMPTPDPITYSQASDLCGAKHDTLFPNTRTGRYECHDRGGNITLWAPMAD